MKEFDQIVGAGCIVVEDRIAVPQKQLRDPAREERAAAQMLVQTADAQQMGAAVERARQTFGEKGGKGRDRQQKEQHPTVPGQPVQPTVQGRQRSAPDVSTIP